MNIVETSDPDQIAWLRALIWPEHQERRSLMDAALARRNAASLELHQGDGFAMFEALSGGIPETSLLCVYHTHVANQIPTASREAFLQVIERTGQRRDIVHVFNNIKPSLHLTAYRNGNVLDLSLANTDGHARWIEWLQN